MKKFMVGDRCKMCGGIPRKVEKHYPNPKTYRPWLGEYVNAALIRLTMKNNANALSPLSVSDYIEKMIAHWWVREFPDEPVPFQTKRYDEDVLYNPLKS